LHRLAGGAAFVALKRTKNPKDVGRFLDFMAGDAVYAEYMAKTENIPASAAVAKKGVEYNIAPTAKAALGTFVGQVGHALLRSLTTSRVIVTTARCSIRRRSAWVKRWRARSASDDALKRIASDVDEQVKAAAK
jgi:alpha-1,4-digalacturonate transport system substrate-binding protein